MVGQFMAKGLLSKTWSSVVGCQTTSKTKKSFDLMLCRMSVLTRF